MADGVGAGHLRDLDLALGDERPGDRGAEQIHALVERVGAEHREHVIAHEFLAQILDMNVLRLDTEQFRLLARRLQLLALAEIGGERHHLAAVGRLQPLEDDGRVEPTGIGEDDLVDALLGHGFGFRTGRPIEAADFFSPTSCRRWGSRVHKAVDRRTQRLA